MERNSWARASSASAVPGSVIAMKSRAGAISDIAVWMGRVEDAELEAGGRRSSAALLAAGPAEHSAEQLRRQARAAHAEHGRAAIPVLADVAGEMLELRD